MNEQPNLTPLQSYAEQYTSAICSDFFDDYEVINGQQIVSLANVHQVNLLVVKNIFEQWKEETAKLQSPLFSYESEEVQEALNQFMNVLSRNISINQAHFTPLFAKATEETLLLLIYPGYFFRNLIQQLNKKIDLQEDLFSVLKYVKVHSDFVANLKSKLSAEGNQIKRKQALKILEGLIEQQDDSIDEPHEMLQQFDEEIPIGLIELSISWKAIPEIADEPDGLGSDVEVSNVDLVQEEEDFFSQTLSSEITEEFEKPFFNEISDDEDDEDDDESFIADHFKTTLDPINDNVFISNQEDILNAAIIEDFDYDTEEPPAQNQDLASVSEPDMLISENPFAGVTSDLEEIAFLAGDEDIPLHFEEDNLEEEAEKTMFSLEEDRAAAPQKDRTPINIEEAEEAPQATEKPAFTAPKEEKMPPLAKQETEEEKRLNDFIAKRIAASQEPSQPTLLDKLKGNSFKKLHGNIPLHQKFKFQNDLFAGNADDFNNAIALIDQAPDYHEALALIKSRFVLKYDWDFSHETTLEFIGMVEDKYD